MKTSLFFLLVFGLILSCKNAPIVYADPRAVADKAIAFMQSGNTDSLIALVHPDNLREIGEETIINVSTEGRALIVEGGGSAPVKVEAQSAEAYNLGGQVVVTTVQYYYPDTSAASVDTLNSVLISVAKGKVIGITVSK